MLEAYFAQEKERAELGIPPLPLSPAETGEVCRFLEAPKGGGGDLILALLRDRVSPNPMSEEPDSRFRKTHLKLREMDRERFPSFFSLELKGNIDSVISETQGNGFFSFILIDVGN